MQILHSLPRFNIYISLSSWSHTQYYHSPLPFTYMNQEQELMWSQKYYSGPSLSIQKSKNPQNSNFTISRLTCQTKTTLCVRIDNILVSLRACTTQKNMYRIRNISNFHTWLRWRVTTENCIDRGWLLTIYASRANKRIHF